MLRKTGLYTVLATLALAAPLHATENTEHYVVLLDTAYFPDVVHPVPGDTILFYNQGEFAMAATASDESWTTGLLEPGEEFTMPVTDGMEQTYTNAVPGAPDPVDGDTVAAAVGVIDYLNPAPVDLGADGKPLMLADEAYAE